MKTVYTIYATNGHDKLARLEVIKETDKTIWVDSYENILNWQHFNTAGMGGSDGRNNKGRSYMGYRLFPDEKSAMEHLIDRAKDYIGSLETKLEDARFFLQGLERQLEELKGGE